MPKLQEHSRIRVIPGTAPVLISSPHTRPITLEKEGLRFTKPSETRVGRLTVGVCRRSGAWGMYIGGKGHIEHWETSTLRTYKRVLKDIIRTHNISLFIDVHGSMEARPFTIDYDFKISKRRPYDEGTVRLEAIILRHLTAENLGAPISKAFFSKERGIARNTLTYFVRRTLGVPSVQFEINKSTRKDPEALRKVRKALYNIVEDWKAQQNA